MIQGQTVKLQGFKGVLSGKHVPGIWWAPPKQMLFSLAPSIPSAAGCLRFVKKGFGSVFLGRGILVFFFFGVGIPMFKNFRRTLSYTWIFRGYFQGAE